jgi:hypothetical protein
MSGSRRAMLHDEATHARDVEHGLRDDGAAQSPASE